MIPALLTRTTGAPRSAATKPPRPAHRGLSQETSQPTPSARPPACDGIGDGGARGLVQVEDGDGIPIAQAVSGGGTDAACGSGDNGNLCIGHLWSSLSSGRGKLDGRRIVEIGIHRRMP